MDEEMKLGRKLFNHFVAFVSCYYQHFIGNDV